MLAAIHALINQFKIAAEQLTTKSTWQLVCKHILTTVARFKAKVPRVLAPPDSGFGACQSLFLG